MSSKIHIDNASISKALLIKIQKKLKAYAAKNSKVGAIIGGACNNKTPALELIYNIYNGVNDSTIITLMTSLLTAIKIDQKHDFNDEGTRCSGGIDVDFIPYSLGAIEKDLKARFIDPSNSKVELITSQTELSGLSYYCMDIGVRDGNAKKLEEDIEKAHKEIAGVSCCPKISTIAQIIDSAGCAYIAGDLNSYDKAKCGFCDNEMTMYNIGFIFYQAFFEYFNNNDEYYIFEYTDAHVLPAASSDLDKKLSLAKQDATKKKLNIVLYSTTGSSVLTKSSCVIGQKGFSVKGICTFLNNDKGMFDKTFVEYIMKTSPVAGNKNAQRQFKTTTCMCIKGYGDFGQLIITSYLNCINQFKNNIMLLTCDRFLVNIACILECPFMLGTNIYPCYLYDTTAKIENKYIIDVWNMSSKNIKIICERLHNPVASAAAAPNLDRNIAALITAQQAHILYKKQPPNKNPKKSNDKRLLKVEEVVKHLNNEERDLYSRYRDDYAIIYNDASSSGSSGGSFYELYDISGLSGMTDGDVDAFFKNPMKNIASLGANKLILKDTRFLNGIITGAPITTNKGAPITTQQYNKTMSGSSGSSGSSGITQIRKAVDASGINYNNFVNVKVFVEGLGSRKAFLNQYTNGGQNGFIGRLTKFAVFEYSFGEKGSDRWVNLGFENPDLDAEVKTKEGYIKILEHLIKSVSKGEATTKIKHFNNFLKTTYKSGKSCSVFLDNPEALINNIPDICEVYINELNTIENHLRYLISVKDDKGIVKDGATLQGFIDKIYAYYGDIKTGFNAFIDAVKEQVGDNLAKNTRPYYVFDYYLNIWENPTSNTYNNSWAGDKDVNIAEASFRLAFKAINKSNENLTIESLKAIVDFVENINSINNFVIEKVIPTKDAKIAVIDMLVAGAKGTGAGLTGGKKTVNHAKPLEKSKKPVKPTKSAKPALITGGGLGSRRSRAGDDISYDTALTELREGHRDDCCYAESGERDTFRRDNDDYIDELKYQEYIRELGIILEYLYGTASGTKGGAGFLTLWEVFCYNYYTRLSDDIRLLYHKNQAELIAELRKDLSVWETFKNEYPIYQYIIEYFYFRTSQGLLYRFIRGEIDLSASIRSSGDTLMVVERYIKFLELENKVEYHIKDYKRYEREQVEALTREMKTGDIGTLYSIIDLQKMLNRACIVRGIFGKSKNHLILQQLSMEAIHHYYPNKDDADARIKDKLYGVGNYATENLELLKQALEYGVLYLTPDIIENLDNNNLDNRVFIGIIRTHLAYFEPTLIYYFSAKKLIIFLENVPLPIEEIREYMINAKNETIDTIINEKIMIGDLEFIRFLILRLPFYHFELAIKKYEAFYMCFALLNKKAREGSLTGEEEGYLNSYKVFFNIDAEDFTQKVNRIASLGIYEKIIPLLAPEQSIQFLFANRNYIRYASPPTPAAATAKPSVNIIGNHISEATVLEVLNFDPSCILFLTFEYTKYILENRRNIIDENRAYIDYLSDDQMRYIIGLILGGGLRSPIKYILEYMSPEHILYCITKGIIKVGSDSGSSGRGSGSGSDRGSGSGSDRGSGSSGSSGSSEHKAIIQIFSPYQLVYIIDVMDKRRRIALIDLLTDETQLMILQLDPKLIVKFAERQRKELVTKGFIKTHQITDVLEEHGAYLLNTLSDKELIEYTDQQPRLYNILDVGRLVSIYRMLKTVPNNDAAILKLLYFINPDKKGDFLVECLEIIVKYHTYIQYLNVKHLYRLFERYVNANDKRAVSFFEKVLALLGNTSRMLEGMYEEYKEYIPFMTEEQIIYLISKRWILDLPINDMMTVMWVNGNEEEIKKVFGRLCDNYIGYIFKGITGEQALTLEILDPRHEATVDEKVKDRTGGLYDLYNYNNGYYRPQKFIDYIGMLTPDVKEYFIKNLGRNDKQKRQLKDILNGNIEVIHFITTTQLIEYIRSTNILGSPQGSPLGKETLNKLSDEHIATIITYSISHSGYLNLISPEQLKRFLKNNKGYINSGFLKDVKLYEVVKNDLSGNDKIITHLTPMKVLGFLNVIVRERGNASSYMEHLTVEQLKYLITKEQPFITEEIVKRSERYQKMFLEHTIERLVKEPEYISTEPEYLKKIYIEKWSNPEDETGILYDAIVKYDKEFFNSLDNNLIAPFLEYNPAYIVSLTLEKQLHFILENWMLLQFISFTRFKKLIIQRKDTYDLIHKSNYKIISDAAAFDLVKFVLKDDCDYRRYIGGLTKEQQKAFNKKYPNMARTKSFNMDREYYDALKRAEERNYNKIKGHLEVINKENAKSVGRWNTPAVRKYPNHFRDDIFRTLPILTDVGHIEDILKGLGDRDLTKYIKKYSGYINYLPEKKILAILGDVKTKDYIKYLDYDKIPQTIRQNIGAKLAKLMTAEQINIYNKKNGTKLSYSPKKSSRSPRSPKKSPRSPRSPNKSSRSPNKSPRSPATAPAAKTPRSSRSPKTAAPAAAAAAAAVAPYVPVAKSPRSPRQSPSALRDEKKVMGLIESNYRHIYTLEPEEVSSNVANKIYELLITKDDKTRKKIEGMLGQKDVLPVPLIKKLLDNIKDEDQRIEIIKKYPSAIPLLTLGELKRLQGRYPYNNRLNKYLEEQKQQTPTVASPITSPVASPVADTITSPVASPVATQSFLQKVATISKSLFTRGGNQHIYNNTHIKKTILGKERSIYKIPKSNKEYIRYKGSYIYVKEYIKLFAKAKAKPNAKPKARALKDAREKPKATKK